MRNDPIVAEVRANRRKLSEKFDFDVARLVADARARQGSSGHRLVSLAVRRPKNG